MLGPHRKLKRLELTMSCRMFRIVFSGVPTLAGILVVAATVQPARAQHDHDAMSPDDPAASTSQASPYTGLENRAIKALSAEQTASLRNGEGMGFALAAELNGYPGPKHVLELEEQLGLSADQVVATRDVFDAMKSAAVELGERIVAREQELDRLFASHEIASEALETITLDIGRLQGELRAVHLKAHLEMVEILSPAQRHAYVMARGYHHGRREH